MNTELVSVVIPTYNRKDLILRSVRSVEEQDYKNIEIIVVDDGSTDGTYKLFENYPDERVRYIRYEENKGACYARNLGADNAKGEYIAFQDSDDVWRPDKLRKQLDYIKESGADLVYCGITLFDAHSKIYCLNYYSSKLHDNIHNDADKFLEAALSTGIAFTQTIFIRRQVMDTVRFDTSCKRFQDGTFS